ncbi:MAG: hypothetical protein B2I17_08660 [Thermoplasmatales archaeon B_DKE]|nr:MAG: hypothetical protein B2I17_08660 [Thermoplasmatales archaeon B_DKE]
MLKRKFVLATVIFVAFAMVMSSMALIGGVAANNSTSSQANTPSSLVASHYANPTLTGKAAQVMKALTEKGIPANYVYLPNFNPTVHKKDGVITPSYTTAPAPMGIGAYGISNNNGAGPATAYNLTTGSVMASLNVSSLQDFYALDDGPNSVTFQLNAVLHNVALFGNSSYAFWTQNVVFYSARTQSLLLLDNLWNFSSPSFTLTQNSLYNYSGIPVAPVYYYAVGPAFHVTYPFSLNLYLNTSVIDGRSAVFYNYSLETSGHYYSGSYDRIIFNSIPSSNPSYTAPPPQYLISGNTITPDGYIPYDAEIMIGGPGGGSTANVLNISATMQLKYMNATTSAYASFPDTFDVGSQTGETSQGVAVSWSPNDVATLTAGPSYLYGMWGLTPASTTMYTYTGSVNPPNSFMFTSPGGPFNATLSAWVPLSNTGKYSFTIPNGSLSANIMLSNYNPKLPTLNPGNNGQLTLTPNFTLGVYTPLYAMDNAQLQYISYYGNGTQGNPYVIYNNAPSSGYINPLFGELNDYAFPAFSGLLLHNVNAYTTVTSEPSFTVNYAKNVYSQIIVAYFGLPSTNNLGIVLYQTSNATVYGNQVTGWFSFEQSEFPVANLLLWNSQNDTVMYNQFTTLDSSMLVYNTQTQDGNNLIYGNLFIQSSQLNAANYAVIAVSTTFGTSPYGPVALTVYSSGNVISGNFFIVYNTAISPNYSIYSGYGVNYTDTWNHNFWWNYVNRSGPYNNNGQITSGYDNSPIIIHGFERYHVRILVNDFKHR